MPDSMPARLPLDQAIDESLSAMFGRLQSEPAPQVLLSLVDQLEAHYRAARVGEERRVAV